MKLKDIHKGVAAYLGTTSADLTRDGVDLGLLAMNQVRQQAELDHDFEFSRKLVTVSVNGITGGSLEQAVIYGTTERVSVKTVVDVGLFDEQGNLVATPWTTIEDSLRLQRAETDRYIPRYPTDGEALAGGLVGGTRFTFAGRNIYVTPKVVDMTYNVGFEAYTFMYDWTDDDLKAVNGDAYEPWSTKGSQYLMWKSITHVNRLYKEFVFRQEGNLPPPDDLADAGLASLVSWDIYTYEQFRQHSR